MWCRNIAHQLKQALIESQRQLAFRDELGDEPLVKVTIHSHDIIVTGHSYGGALAVLNTLSITNLGLQPTLESSARYSICVSCYTTACPPVLTLAGARHLEHSLFNWNPRWKPFLGHYFASSGESSPRGPSGWPSRDLDRVFNVRVFASACLGLLVFFIVPVLAMVVPETRNLYPSWFLSIQVALGLGAAAWGAAAGGAARLESQAAAAAKAVREANTQAVSRATAQPAAQGSVRSTVASDSDAAEVVASVGEIPSVAYTTIVGGLVAADVAAQPVPAAVTTGGGSHGAASGTVGRLSGKGSPPGAIATASGSSSTQVVTVPTKKKLKQAGKGDTGRAQAAQPQLQSSSSSKTKKSSGRGGGGALLMRVVHIVLAEDIVPAAGCAWSSLVTHAPPSVIGHSTIPVRSRAERVQPLETAMSLNLAPHFQSNYNAAVLGEPNRWAITAGAQDTVSSLCYYFALPLRGFAFVPHC